jgi:hypothetical protein
MHDDKFALLSDVPGAPRTETLIFATGRGAEVPPSVPLDDMCDIAARVLRDGVGMTQETGNSLCNAILELYAQFVHKSEQLEIALLQLSEAEVLRRASLEDALQQRDLAIQLSEENRGLRLESSAYLDLQVCIDRSALDVEKSSGQWGSNDDTVVQETSYVCDDIAYGAVAHRRGVLQ